MAGNFQFTGAPKPAMYKPKGLDYFLQAPKLQAEVQGAAMRLNQATQLDKRGIHSSDVDLANKMGSHIEKGVETMTDNLLSGGAVTDAQVTSMVKNFNNAKEVQQKFSKMLENAKRIEQADTFFRQQGTKPGQKMFMDKLKSVSMGQWNGSFDPETGEAFEFQIAESPGFVNVTGDFEKELSVAMGNMQPEDRKVLADIDASSIKIITKKLENGAEIPYMVYDKGETNIDNHDAIDKALEAMNAKIADPNSQVAQYLGFMGKEYTTGIINSLPGIAERFYRENTKASNIGMQQVSGGAAKAPVTVVSTPGARNSISVNTSWVDKSSPITMKDPDNYQKAVYINPDDPSKGTEVGFDYGTYSAKAKENNVLLWGSASPKLAEIRSAYFGDGVMKNNKVPILDDEGKQIKNQVFDYSPEFSSYIQTNKALGTVADLGKFMSELEGYGVETLEITEEDYKNKDTSRGERIYDLKIKAGESTANLYNAFQKTQRSLLRGWDLGFDVTMSNGKSVDTYDDFKEQLKEPSRRVITMTRSGDNRLSYYGDTGSDKVKDGISSTKTRDDFNRRLDVVDFKTGKGFPTRPKLITDANLETLIPNIFKGKDKEQKARIQKNFENMYMYEYTVVDEDTGTEETRYTFITSKPEDKITSPTEAKVKYATIDKEGKPTAVKEPQKIGLILSNMENASSVYLEVPVPSIDGEKVGGIPVEITKRGMYWSMKIGGRVVTAKSRVEIIAEYNKLSAQAAIQQ